MLLSLLVFAAVIFIAYAIFTQYSKIRYDQPRE